MNNDDFYSASNTLTIGRVVGHEPPRRNKDDFYFAYTINNMPFHEPRTGASC